MADARHTDGRTRGRAHTSTRARTHIHTRTRTWTHALDTFSGADATAGSRVDAACLPLTAGDTDLPFLSSLLSLSLSCLDMDWLLGQGVSCSVKRRVLLPPPVKVKACLAPPTPCTLCLSTHSTVPCASAGIAVSGRVWLGGVQVGIRVCACACVSRRLASTVCVE